MASRSTRQKAQNGGGPLSQFISDQARVLAGQEPTGKRPKRKSAPATAHKETEPRPKTPAHDGPLDTFIVGAADTLALRTPQTAARHGTGKTTPRKAKPKEPAPAGPPLEPVVQTTEGPAATPTPRPKRSRKVADDKAPASPPPEPPPSSPEGPK